MSAAPAPCRHEPELVARRVYADGRVEQRERCAVCGEEAQEYRVRRGRVEVYAGARRMPQRVWEKKTA